MVKTIRNLLSLPTVGALIGLGLLGAGLAMVAPWLALVVIGMLLLVASIVAALPRRTD